MSLPLNPKLKFLIDENVRKEVGIFLKKQGYDVITVPSGEKDKNVATLAFSEKRILLTHDKDFTNILIYPPEKYFGIIRLKIHPPILSDIFSALQRLLKDIPAEKFIGKLFVLENEGVRIWP